MHKDITGNRYGKLVAVRFIGRRRGQTYWEFKCDCGNSKAVSLSNIQSGSIVSCGCLRRDYISEVHSVKRVRPEYSAKVMARHKRLREEFLEMYGNACRCCGENRKEFLTIEHINGQKGGKEYATQSYRKAVSEYRPDLYEILCMNCNHARGRYGYCPHDLERMTSSLNGLNSSGIPLMS